MNIFLDKLSLSIKHLGIIDDIFCEYDHPQKDIYIKIRKRIEEIDKKWSSDSISPSEQLYVGGKKANQYSRTMILSDLVEYIITGRLYHFYLPIKKDIKKFEKKSDFIRIILLLLNQLFIWDSLSINKTLRNEVLKTLEKEIPLNSFFKNESEIENHKKLLKVDEDIGISNPVIEDLPSIKGDKKLKNVLSEYYDSLLPKTGQGLWNELITYLYMLKTNVGYILPLLLTQRIYSFDQTLKPPDFIVIDYDNTIKSIHINNESQIGNISDQQLIGVEVGRGKETQSGDFSFKTKQPAITVSSENIPPRCPICGVWILFCDQVINNFSDLNNPLTFIKDHFRCLYHCEIFKPKEIYEGKCPNIQYNGNLSDDTKKNKLKIIIPSKINYHYHYKCVKEVGDEVAEKFIQNAWKQFNNHIKEQPDRFSINPKKKSLAFVSNYPHIRGIELLEMYTNRSKLFCFGQPDLVLNKRNCNFGYCKFADRCKLLSAFIKMQKEKGSFENKKKTIEDYF